MNDFEPISEEKLNKVFIEKKLNIDCKCRNENIYIDIQNKRIECAKCGAILDLLMLFIDCFIKKNDIWKG